MWFVSDVDECLDTPCGQNAVCSNYDGGYTCQCLDGFNNITGACQGSGLRL